MFDYKLLIFIILVCGALAAAWWLGWFKPAGAKVQQFLNRAAVTR